MIGRAFFAGRPYDPDDVPTSVAPEVSEPETTVLCMTPAAIRARNLRAKRTTARAEAKALVKVPPADRKNNDEIIKTMLGEQKEFNEQRETEARWAETSPNADDNQPMCLTGAPRGKGSISSNHGEEKLAALSEARLDGPSQGRRVTPKGEGHRFGERDEQFTSSVPLNKEENFPSYRSTSPFRVRGLDGQDVKRKLLADLFDGQVFEIIPDSDIFRCTVCGFESDWESTARRHLENLIDDEEIAFVAASKRARAIKSALADMPSMPGVFPVSKPVRGGHSGLFERARAARRKRQIAANKAISQNGSNH
jgi:hypothetical protein